MKLSLRELLVYTAAASFVLSLVRVPIWLGGALLAMGVIVSFFAIPRVLWRHVVYGGLCGIVVVLICLLVFVRLQYGPTWSGRGSPARDVMERVQPYILPLGSLLGGTLGLALWKTKRRIPA